MSDLSLKVDPRSEFGRKAKVLTKQGKVLGNIVGRGEESRAVSADYSELSKVVAKAGKTQPIQLEIDGSGEQLVLINDVERDTLTQRLHHVTFQAIHKGEKVHTEIPIKFIGDAPAARTGKILVTILEQIEVKADPTSIPEAFEVDISNLEEIGDSIAVSDIKTQDSLEILVDSEQLLMKVDAPRAEEEPEETEEEELSADDIPSDHGGDEEETSNEKSEEAESDS